MKLKRLLACVLSTVLAAGTFQMPVSRADSKLLAFPGAEGGGKYTTGARGKTAREVYHVTNLNDSGSGSLRDAVSKEGRIVVFDISGIITLQSKLSVSKPNITILGQTAPGDGITVSGYDVGIGADNIIMRYLRIRPTDSQGGEPDGLGGRWVDNIILDHCSVSWGVDELLTLYAGSLENGTPSENITVQYCLSSESLRMSNHFKGAHGYGGIIGGTNATYHHNLFAHHDSRNPRLDRNLMSTDMVNNVIYNWGNNGTYGGEPYSYNKKQEYSTEAYASNVNIRNNYYKSGPSTKQSIRSKIFEVTNDGKVKKDGTTSSSVVSSDEMLKSNFYINGNYVYGNAEATANNTKSSDYVMNMDKANLLSAPVSMGEYEIPSQTAEEAFDDVIANVGATLPKRDDIDARVVADVKNGTGRIINGIAEVGGFSGITSEKRVFTIPDEWKSTSGMGSSAETDLVTGGIWTGYTWIEAYVNDWTQKQSAPTNPDITVTSPEIADTTKTTDKTNETGFWSVITEDETVTYSASASPKAGTSIEKIEIYDGTELIDTVTESSVNKQLTLEAGTHYLTSKTYNNKGEKTTSPTSIVYVTKNDGLIGDDTVSEIGKASFAGKNNVWTKNGITYIGGSGLINGSSDSFSYWKHPVTGDFEFSVKVESVPKFENGALCGIMFRESLDAGSRMVMISDGWKKYGQNIMIPKRTETNGSVSLGWMKDSGGNDIANNGDYVDDKNGPNYPMPSYMKIARSGDTLTLSVSNDGKDWTNNARQPLQVNISGWSKNAYIGLAIDSINGKSNEASPMLPWYSIGAFSDIKMTGVTPYGITLDANGGAINSGNITTYEYDDKQALPTDVTRSGYTFMGWCDNAEGKGVTYTEMPATAAGNITLYAKWYEGVYVPTPTPEATSTPEPVVPQGLTKISERRTWAFDDAVNAPSEDINGLSVIQGSKEITFAKADKSLNNVKYNSVMKFPGGGNIYGVCAAFFPAYSGTVNVIAAHPNGSNERQLVINNGTENQFPLSTTDLKLCTVSVTANTPVYIYSGGSGLDVYSIEYIPDEIPAVTPSPTVTPTPDTTNQPSVTTPAPDKTAKPEDTPSPNVTPGPGNTQKPDKTPDPVSTPDIQTSQKPLNSPTPDPVQVKGSIRYDEAAGEAVITSASAIMGTVIFACYDNNGRLMAVKVKENTEIEKGETRVSTDTDFTALGGNVKVYLWNSLNSMQPVFKEA